LTQQKNRRGKEISSDANFWQPARGDAPAPYRLKTLLFGMGAKFGFRWERGEG
jgi:hypothetical protein